MGRRLLTKAPAVSTTGELLVNFAAGRDEGAQVGNASIGGSQTCVPFSGGAPLADRKWLVITNVSETVYLEVGDLLPTASYALPGAGRGLNQSNAPNTAKYSNRKQFLRGQYLSVPLFSDVTMCCKSGATEIAASLELS